MFTTLSVYLDLIRFTAAVVVLVVHADYERFTGGLPVLWRLNNLGNDAVIVFFVLSGFVIAFVVDTKEKDLTEYIVSRFARLWSVALPALLLTCVLDTIGSCIRPEAYTSEWSPRDNLPWRLLANGLFINELWFISIRPMSNGPFWSLGYEFWYYMIYGAATLLTGLVRLWWVGLFVIVAGPKILLLFPVWLMGTWLYGRVQRQPLGPLTGGALAIGSILAYIAIRGFDVPDTLLAVTRNVLPQNFVEEKLRWSAQFVISNIVGILVTTHLWGVAALLRISSDFPAQLTSIIRALASYTFATYLFHYPLLQFFGALTQGHLTGIARVVIVLTAVICSVAILGTVTEGRKSEWKHGLNAANKAILKLFRQMA